MNLEMLLYRLVPGGEITQPPAGHGIGLGTALTVITLSENLAGLICSPR